MRPFYRFLIVFLSLVLATAACGGGGQTSAPPKTKAPTNPPTATHSPTATVPQKIADVNPLNDLVEQGKDTGSLSKISSQGPLYNNDTLRVTSGGRCRLDFGYNMWLQLFNDTQLGKIQTKLDPSTPWGVQAYLSGGGFIGDITQTGGKATFDTPNGAKITILGTSFFVAYNPASQVTTVGNFGGKIEVTLGTQTITLPDKQQLDVLPDRILDPLDLPFTMDEFEGNSILQQSPLDGLAVLRQDYGQPSPGQPIQAGREVHLTLWGSWNDQVQEIIADSLHTYQASHPNLQVDLVQQNPEELMARLITSLQAGDGPDIVYFSSDQAAQLVQEQLLVDLRSLDVNEDYLFKNFAPAAAGSVMWQGGIWGLPAEQSGIALIYNRPLLERFFGQQVLPSDPLNFDDLLERAAVYYQKNNNEAYLLCNPGLSSRDAYHAAPIYFGFGLPAFVDENRKVYLDTPEAMQAGQWIANLSAYSYPQAGYPECLRLFQDQQVAVLWSGPWALPQIEEAGIEYGVQPMGRPFVGTSSYMLTHVALDNQAGQEALDLIRYLTGADVSRRLALEAGLIPANRGALNDPALLKRPDIGGFAAALDLGVPLPPSPYAGAQWGPVGDATYYIWTGELTPEEALATAQQQIESQVGPR